MEVPEPVGADGCAGNFLVSGEAAIAIKVAVKAMQSFSGATNQVVSDAPSHNHEGSAR